MEDTKNIDALVVELLDVFGEFRYEDLIEYIWRSQDLDLDDLPEEQVISKLENLEKEGRLVWEREEDVIRLSPSVELSRKQTREFLMTLTKWRATIVGSYLLPDNSEIDTSEVLEILGSINIDVGTLKRRLTENREINFDWSIGGIRCESLWSANRFHIHSYVFEEPFPEIVRYWETEIPSAREQTITVLPSAGAFFVYSVMREILKERYPQISIRIDEIDLRLTRGIYL